MATATRDLRKARQIGNRVREYYQANPAARPRDAKKAIKGATDGQTYGIRSKLVEAGEVPALDDAAAMKKAATARDGKTGRGRGPKKKQKSTDGNGAPAILDEIQKIDIPQEAEGLDISMEDLPTESEQMLAMVTVAQKRSTEVVAHMLELHKLRVDHEAEVAALVAKQRAAEFVITSSLIQELCKA